MREIKSDFRKPVLFLNYIYSTYLIHTGLKQSMSEEGRRKKRIKIEDILFLMFSRGNCTIIGNPGIDYKKNLSLFLF